MKKNILFGTLFLCNLFYSQVGIGTPSPDNSAMLEVVSLTKGVLVPRMTTAERDAIPAPANALTIFNLSEQCYNYYDLPTTVWKSLCAGATTTNPVVTALTCGYASQTGIVTAGQAVSGATLTVPYTGGNGASYAAGTPVAPSGGTVTGVTLTLQAGNLAIGAGSLVYTISGTPSGVGSAVFSLAFGGQVCNNATVTSTAAASVASLTCTATQSGTLTVGTSASGVSFTVPYTGGNGSAYGAGTGVASTGVTGLTATLVAGTLANGAGNLTYNVTGTPSGSGQAYFNLTFGSANCASASVTISNSLNSNIFADNFSVGRQSVFAICSDGSVMSQGANNYGELGTGNGTSTTAGSNTAYNMVGFGPGFKKAVAVKGSFFSTLILTDTGDVWGTGLDDGSSLAQGTGSTYLSPVQLKGVGGTGFLTGIKFIAGGREGSFAIKTNGDAYAWGANTYGQLGVGSGTNVLYPTAVKGIGGVGTLQNVTQIVTNDEAPSHALALLSNGNVAAMGYNGFGQLGDATVVDRNSPVLVRGVSGVGVLSNVKAVAASERTSAAVLNDGTVYAWGINNNGELGQNSSSPASSISPLQVKGVGGVGFLTGIIDIKGTSQWGFVALKSDGTVYTWGRGQFGQNGDGALTTNLAPVQVKGVGGVGFLSGITAIDAHERNIVAMGSDGKLYEWGENSYNQMAPNITAGAAGAQYQKTPVILTNFCTVQ